MTDAATARAQGIRALAALDEFLTPAFDTVRDDYMRKLAKIAAEPLDDKLRAAMEKLALAIKVVDQTEIQIRALVAGGEVVETGEQRSRKIADMPAERRRWLY
jgi:hypothetical protein